jgi:hypothetical protein
MEKRRRRDWEKEGDRERKGRIKFENERSV